jgi:hypothetical protein
MGAALVGLGTLIAAWPGRRPRGAMRPAFAVPGMRRRRAPVPESSEAGA